MNLKTVNESKRHEEYLNWGFRGRLTYLEERYICVIHKILKIEKFSFREGLETLDEIGPGT